MKLLSKFLLGLMLIPSGLLCNPAKIHASQVATQWYFGSWDCNIDGRSAKMQWLVVDDPQISCSGDVCSTTSGVKVVGKFSDNGGPWVPLAKLSANPTSLSIRYLGQEQNNWFLRYNVNSRQAIGWTTWREKRYPLSCANRRR
ncbi:hypothetical protein H6G25_09890 [Dolichospermum sp. FACHB-1091]|uniref:DUF6006 family protein n=1 Tax=Dolichospermum sp. FACHB-1091 TaxID=2692798 RepID=UPI001680E72F|nr:DUF6006 family protein [Dolichospermum sp. FACHB-1091]MBD2443497.1 hypothetical protein [Dolichospermum sp. FACHB-1091]